MNYTFSNAEAFFKSWGLNSLFKPWQHSEYQIEEVANTCLSPSMSVLGKHINKKKKNGNKNVFQCFCCCWTWAKLNPSHMKCLQVPSLIPVLLYKLGRTTDPSVTHAVLYCLPGLGTHKVMNGPLDLVHSNRTDESSKMSCRWVLSSSTSSLFLILQLCISMVLQTLSMVASAPKMSAVAMRLLTALWKLQVCHGKWTVFILI